MIAYLMQNEFEISMDGELSYFLGLQVSQLDKDIFISQIKYMKGMLKKFNMEDSKLVTTPMMISCKLIKDEYLPKIDQTLCRYMIGGLLYLTTFRLDIL